MKKDNLFYAAFYLRLSRDDGDKTESDSIDNQRKILADYIKNKSNFILYDEYVDDGYTGTDFNRPAFQRMLTDIKTDRINCIIVKDLSRLGRDYIEMGYYLERYFVNENIRFIAVNDNIDSFIQDYDLLLPVKNVFNEQYARDISKKVQSAFKAKQKEGQFIGAFPSYGYQRDVYHKNRLIIDEYAASVVRKIFRLYIEGKGKIAIAKILNEEGILCPSEYKKVSGLRYTNGNRLSGTAYWTYPTVHRMLSNEIYAGNMVQGKTKRRMKGKPVVLNKEDWIVVPNTHEAIIDKDTWNRVQNLLKRETKQLNLNENISIFAGFLKCGDCGRALTKKKGSDGRILYYCSSYTRYGKSFCSPHKIYQEDLEAMLLCDLNAILRKTDNLTGIITEQIKNNFKNNRRKKPETNKINAEMTHIRKLKKEAYEDYKEGILNKEDFLSFRDDYQKKENILRKKLALLNDTVNNNKYSGACDSPWLKNLMQSQKVLALDRSTITDMIDMVYVYENRKIKIIYHFSEEADQMLKQLSEI